MLNSTTKDIAIDILTIMWNISQSKSKIIAEWEDGRIAGLYSALYSVMLYGRN